MTPSHRLLQAYSKARSPVVFALLFGSVVGCGADSPSSDGLVWSFL